MTKKSILSSTIQVTAITFSIKLIAVLKQIILASVCGANIDTDIFFMASGVMTNLGSVFFSAISISLLSMYTGYTVIHGQTEADSMITSVLKVILPLSVALALLFTVGAPVVGWLIAPSYAGDSAATLQGYIRIMSLTLVTWCYQLTLNVVLEANKRFVPGKCYALFQNCFLIIAALLFYKRIGVWALLIAFVLAGIAQCVFVSICAKKDYNYSAQGPIDKSFVKKLLVLCGPLFLGNAIYEINDIVDKRIASDLSAGSVSCLNYGASVNEIVTTVIITSVSTVLFSHFATWAAEGKKDQIAAHLKSSMEYIVTLTMPILVMCLLCGNHIVAALYERGSFDQENTMATYGVVAGYALGFVFQAARANLVKVYYAFQNTRTPMINGLISVAVNIALSITLSKIFGVGGIAAATSVALMIATLLLLHGLGRYLPGFSFQSSYIEYEKTVFSAIIAAAAVWLVRNFAPIHKTFLILLVEGVVCLLAYIAMLCVTRNHCMQNVLHMVKLKKRT